MSYETVVGVFNVAMLTVQTVILVALLVAIARHWWRGR